MFNGIGIDFGATGCRAALCDQAGGATVVEDGVPGESPVLFTIESKRVLPVRAGAASGGGVSRWLRIESAKSNLGTARALRNEKNVLHPPPEEEALARLKRLKQKLEQQFGIEILGAALAVPACYGVNQRAALRAVAEAAGFGKVVLIDEPVAATNATCQDKGERVALLAYCLGRSVFSASVLILEDGNVRGIAHEGSTQLGGQDFEAMLVQDILLKARAEGFNIQPETTSLQKLIRDAEIAKIALSTQSETTLRIGPLTDILGRAFRAKTNITRLHLNDLILPLVAETVALAAKAVEGAGLRPQDIRECLLIGEPTRTPLVEQEISRTLGWSLNRAAPHAVASGAALFAARLNPCFEPRAEGELQEKRVVPSVSDHVNVPSPKEKGVDSEDLLLSGLSKVRGLSRSGDVEGCIVAFEDLLGKAHEELSYLYSQSASKLRQAGRIQESVARLVQGLKHWPQNQHIRRKLAGIYVEDAERCARNRMLDQCRHLVGEALKLDPENARAVQFAKELSELDKKSRPSKGKRKKR